MKRKIFAALLAAALVLCLLPATASAAATSVTVGGVVLDGTTNSTYWLNGNTTATGATGTVENYNAWFDATTGTLTLKDANIVGAIVADATPGNSNFGIYCGSGDLTIKLEGTNKVTAGEPSDGGQSHGIYDWGILTINGTGSLVAESKSSGLASYGVRSQKINIDGVTVTAIGGTATGTGNAGSCGVFGPSGITIKDSTVTATGGTTATHSYGLYAATGIFGGEIKIDNSTVTANTTSTTGTRQAMYREPTLTGVQAQGSTASDGSNPVTYVAANNSRYLWVHAAPAVAIGFSGLTANGSDTETTNTLTLTFDQDVTGLEANDITLTGATKGTLTKVTGQTGQYTLAISDITVADGEDVTVAVAKTGFAFNPASQTVAVRVHTPPAPTITITPSGGAVFPQGAATGNAVFIIDSNDPSLNPDGNFDKATLDGRSLDLGGVDGTVEPGSIKITIFQEKLNTLAAGDHPLVVTLKGGAFAGKTVSGVIRVTAPAPIPATGDGSTPLIWAGLLVLAAGALLVLRRKRRVHG